MPHPFKNIFPLFLMVLAGAVASTGCSESNSNISSNNQAAALKNLPEGKLAAIDAGTLNVTEAMVRPYKSSLDSLQRKCTEPRDRISDFAVVGVNGLKEKGVKVTLRLFLEMMSGAIPSAAGRVECAEIAAALVVMTSRP